MTTFSSASCTTTLFLGESAVLLVEHEVVEHVVLELFRHQVVVLFVEVEQPLCPIADSRRRRYVLGLDDFSRDHFWWRGFQLSNEVVQALDLSDFFGEVVLCILFFELVTLGLPTLARALSTALRSAQSGRGLSHTSLP